jgi:hypothetical protein
VDRLRSYRQIGVGLRVASVAIFCFGMTFVLAVFYIA